MASSNSNAFQTLDGWIRDLNAVGSSVPEMAKALVPVVQSEIRATVAAQQSLSGQKWAPTKAGTPALQGAADATTTQALGTVILITVTGHDVFHQFGTHRVPARPILPAAGLPSKLGNAIRKGIVNMGLPFMTRAGRHDKGTGGVKMSPTMGAGRAK